MILLPGFSERESESQKGIIQSKLSALEGFAYQLAGHPFSLTSVDDIGQVLYAELHLPVNGDRDRSIKAACTRRTASSRYDSSRNASSTDVCFYLYYLCM